MAWSEGAVIQVNFEEWIKIQGAADKLGICSEGTKKEEM